MRVLSFDIEEWYIEKHFKGGRKEKYYQYDKFIRTTDEDHEKQVQKIF